MFFSEAQKSDMRHFLWRSTGIPDMWLTTWRPQNIDFVVQTIQKAYVFPKTVVWNIDFPASRLVIFYMFAYVATGVHRSQATFLTRPFGFVCDSTLCVIAVSNESAAQRASECDSFVCIGGLCERRYVCVRLGVLCESALCECGFCAEFEQCCCSASVDFTCLLCGPAA